MINPILPILPNVQTTIIPLDAFAGQKTERSQEMPRKVVDRKKETSAAREEVPREQVERAADRLNRLMKIIGKDWGFQVKDEDGGVIIRIIDQHSSEILESISPGRLMEILETFNEAAGLFFDEQV